jgi:predicted NAD/FAD-binding protein
MSFSVSCGDCGLEWSGRRPYAQRRNLASPRFHAFALEVGRWLRTARRSLDAEPVDEETLERYVTRHGYSSRFRKHFLVPLTAALWSTAPERALEVPAAHALRFFDNHRMLGFGRFGWLTVTGGSRCYVDGVLERLRTVRLGLGARAIRRTPAGIELTTDDGGTAAFDKIVLATHADQALALLTDPSVEERRTLGRFRYTPNDTVLHTDERFLPRARSARASWNYQLGSEALPTITYYLNRLQRLETDVHYCVTLNRAD